MVDEDRATLEVGKEGLMWDLPHNEVFEVLGSRYHRDGEGVPRRVANVLQRHGQLVEEEICPPPNERATENKVSKRTHSTAALTCRGASSLGEQNSTSHLSSQDARGRELGRI